MADVFLKECDCPGCKTQFSPNRCLPFDWYGRKYEVCGMECGSKLLTSLLYKRMLDLREAVEMAASTQKSHSVIIMDRKAAIE